MQFDEFVGRVHNRAELASTGEALRAIRATLQTLSERVYFDEAQDLAAQLPREIGEYLTMVDDVESFSLGEFLDRVAERETVDLPDATAPQRSRPRGDRSAGRDSDAGQDGRHPRPTSRRVQAPVRGWQHRLNDLALQRIWKRTFAGLRI